MRVAICTEPGHLELQERPTPEPDEQKVVIRVAVCGVCGSDVTMWRGHRFAHYPYSPGHEFCGLVEKVGAAAPARLVGQRVVVDPNLGCGDCRLCRMGRPNLCDHLKSRPIKSNGGLADYVALDHRMVHVLPDELPDELAPFVEPLSCALHIAARAGVQPAHRVAIFGAGLMGRLVGLALRPSPAEVVFVEPSCGRRADVERLLDAEALSPVRLMASNHVGQIDVAIECSGSPEAIGQAAQVVRKAGRLVVAGLVAGPAEAQDLLAFVATKELELVGAWLNPNTFVRALELAVQLRSSLESVERRAFALDEVPAAFACAARGEVPKVLVRP